MSGGVDERLDPEKATRAAGRLLRQNHSALGSWPLALTAYNHGLGGVKHAQRKFGPDLVTIIDKYNGPRFGYASMNFYSEFLAAVEIYNNYQNYFGKLVLDKPGDRVATDKPQNVVFNLTGLATLAPDPLTIGSGTDLGLADFRPRQPGVLEIGASTNGARSVQVLEIRSNIPWTEIVATIVGGLLGGAFAAWRQGLGRNAALFHIVVGPFVAYALVWAAQSHLVSRLQPDLVASVPGVFVISLLAGWMGSELFGFVFTDVTKRSTTLGFRRRK
jgi:Transglycosylase SLT domain